MYTNKKQKKNNYNTTTGTNSSINTNTNNNNLHIYITEIHTDKISADQAMWNFAWGQITNIPASSTILRGRERTFGLHKEQGVT
jgi:hypothetical protein